MSLFLISLAILIVGYIIYGKLTEKIFGIDPNRPTPAITKRDDVDYTPMSSWRVFLIQFLNIAGLGPIFGAIMGVMFGPAAFLWIVFGTIFAGAVHDYLSAMVCVRAGGISLPEIVGHELGNGIKQVMRGFSIVLLILVGVVFVITPADIISGITPEWMDKNFWVLVIFIYYILATLLPIDKLIGNFYPIFGCALLFMAIGLMGVMIFGDVTIPDGLTDGLYNRYPADQAATHPIFPMMFVSIACGAISGFHATQSPMMARCITNEKLGRPIFFGAMVAEGIVALIWAAAAITFTGGYEGLASYMSEHSAGQLVRDVSFNWLGTIGGLLAVLGVVVAPITTGDTALRSARLIAADFLKLNQKKISRRLIISVPLFIIAYIVMQHDFNILWRYFAWSNQTLAVFTLWAVTVYLARKRKFWLISIVPALFMTTVSVSYLLIAPSPEGFGLNHTVAYSCGIATAALLLIIFFIYRKRLLSNDCKKEFDY